MSDSQPGDELFAEVAWERLLRILTVVALVTTVFMFTATAVLPTQLSTIAVGAIGSIAFVTAIIGFLIGAASTLEHAEERAGETARRAAEKQRADASAEENESDRETS